MKKIWFILLFGTGIFWANDVELASTILNKLIIAVTAKENPKVYLYRENEALETYPASAVLVKGCEEADIVIVSTLKQLPKSCDNKILLGTRYMHLEDPRVIGAFFWQKGRPNILFYHERLHARKIVLDRVFDKYIESE